MQFKNFKIEVLSGQDISKAIESLAALRIEVFKEFPYLYDGQIEYEKKYLQKFQSNPKSFIVVATQNDMAVGASSAIPLVFAESEIQAPFKSSGYNVDDWIYFGESVLKNEYRGQGLGSKLFDVRIQEAEKIGYKKFCFCAVERAENHPLRPQHYTSLDDFWSKKGFQIQPNLFTKLSWKEISNSQENQNKLIFRTKENF